MFKLFKKKSKTKEILAFTDYNIYFNNKVVDNTPVELLEIGAVNLPSGQIVVCDPLAYYDMPALTRKVKPGKYPVKIYVAKTEKSGDRYAIAKLEFSKSKAVKWVMAVRPNDDVSTLKDESEFFGFPVDAGLGGFLDADTSIVYKKFINEFMEKNPAGNIYDDFFAAEFKKNANPNNPNYCGDWVNYTFPGTELNVTMFHSGFGDGSYPAYWGIDENGKIVSLVIDFLVLLVPEF